MSVVVEFIGGPLDGDLRELPALDAFYLVELPPQADVAAYTSPAPLVPSDRPLPSRTGLYCVGEQPVVGDPWAYHWIGER